MTPALLKLLTPHLWTTTTWSRLRSREELKVTRIDEISDRNYRLAMENPEAPVLSVAEKFTKVRYAPVDNVSSFGKRYGTKL